MLMRSSTRLANRASSCPGDVHKGDISISLSLIRRMELLVSAAGVASLSGDDCKSAVVARKSRAVVNGGTYLARRRLVAFREAWTMIFPPPLNCGSPDVCRPGIPADLVAAGRGVDRESERHGHLATGVPAARLDDTGCRSHDTPGVVVDPFD